MNSDSRGLHFLVGLATLWLTWRLYSAGIIFAGVAYALGHDGTFATSENLYGGPGAVLIGFVIELVITIGWVATLVASGLWDALMVAGTFLRDGLDVAKGSLTAWQSAEPAGNKPSPSPATASPVGPASTDPILATLQVLVENDAITHRNLNSLDMRLTAVESGEQHPTTTEGI